VIARVRRWFGRSSQPSTFASPAADDRDVRAFLSGPRVYGPAVLEGLAARYPALADTVVQSARRALRHEFNLLGSGPYVPIDPDRPARGTYHPIDWTLDPVTGARFPNAQPSQGCDLASIRPPASDIKRPWEQARCYHWVTLAQAYALSSDAAFARELFDQCDDFMEANPVGRGIHWTCTMDVAIRAANWTVALELIRSADVAADRWTRALAALLAHGAFIRSHLENHYEVTSNHFLSNVIGLMVLGRAFDYRDEGKGWLAYARASVEAEMQIQVLEDGADFESSIPYHRLVTELFFSALRVAESSGAPLSTDYRARLRRMHEFIGSVLRPDGLMPQVGDADDGRLHVFRGHDLQNPQDPRHLFGPAAAAYGEPAWLPLAGDEAAWDAAWWGLTCTPVPFAPPDVDAFFPHAGIAVRRRASGTYILVSNGTVGTKGFGNHKHNDVLSLECHIAGQPLIVDPGSYVYTSDPEARNLFRSLVSHSAVMAGDLEPNEVKPEWLFRMFERATPEHVRYEAEGAQFTYDGRHSGFSAVQVIVRRRVTLLGDELVVEDENEATPALPVPLTWRFQLAPGVEPAITSATVTLRTPTGSFALDVPDHLDVWIEPAWYSPSYGVRLPTHRIVCRGVTAPGVTGPWRFRLAKSPVGQ
jgi:heparinase II/III-like protein